MAAPIPTRSQANMAPPLQPQTQQQMHVPRPVPGTWTPDAGIKFGIPNPAPGLGTGPSEGPPGPKKGQWVPNQGIRFG